jgi:hypothetical protein
VDGDFLDMTGARTSLDETIVDRTRLGGLVRLGSGGTAIVYRLPEFSLPGLPPLVFKEFKKKTREHAGPALRTGLVSLVQYRLRMDEERRQRWDGRIVWPLRVVVDEYDNGAACGILMPLIPARFFQTMLNRAAPPASKPREVDLLFGGDQDMARVGLAATSIRERLAIAVQIAKVYAYLHEGRMVAGDISGRNIVYDPTGGRPRVLVVDADSARMEGGRGAFGSQPHTPHWEPPEAMAAVRHLRALQRHGGGDVATLSRLASQTTVQNKATDVYKLGLMLVRVVDHGRGRSVNRDPAKAVALFRRSWGRPAAALLERCVGDVPGDRPTARELYHSMRLLPPKSSSPPPDPPMPQTGAADGAEAGDFVYRAGLGWVRKKPGSQPPDGG